MRREVSARSAGGQPLQSRIPSYGSQGEARLGEANTAGTAG